MDPMLSADLAGKLRTCGGCGKLEAKRGSLVNVQAVMKNYIARER